MVFPGSVAWSLVLLGNEIICRKLWGLSAEWRTEEQVAFSVWLFLACECLAHASQIRVFELWYCCLRFVITNTSIISMNFIIGQTTHLWLCFMTSEMLFLLFSLLLKIATLLAFMSTKNFLLDFVKELWYVQSNLFDMFLLPSVFVPANTPKRLFINAGPTASLPYFSCLIDRMGQFIYILMTDSFTSLA